MMVRNVRNLVDHLLTELDLSNLLVLIINQSDKSISINPHSEVIDIETSGVLLEMNLVITTSKVSHDITKSISIVEEACINQLELFSTCVGISLDLEEFHEGFLVAWAAVREHSLVVKLGSDVGMKATSTTGFAYFLLRSGWWVLDGVLLLTVLGALLGLNLVRNDGSFGVIGGSGSRRWCWRCRRSDSGCRRCLGRYECLWSWFQYLLLSWLWWDNTRRCLRSRCFLCESLSMVIFLYQSLLILHIRRRTTRLQDHLRWLARSSSSTLQAHFALHTCLVIFIVVVFLVLSLLFRLILDLLLLLDLLHFFRGLLSKQIKQLLSLFSGQRAHLGVKIGIGPCL